MCNCTKNKPKSASNSIVKRPNTASVRKIVGRRVVRTIK